MSENRDLLQGDDWMMVTMEWLIIVASVKYVLQQCYVAYLLQLAQL